MLTCTCGNCIYWQPDPDGLKGDCFRARRMTPQSGCGVGESKERALIMAEAIIRQMTEPQNEAMLQKLASAVSAHLAKDAK